MAMSGEGGPCDDMLTLVSSAASTELRLLADTGLRLALVSGSPMAMSKTQVPY